MVSMTQPTPWQPLSIPARCVLSSPWLWRRCSTLGVLLGGLSVAYAIVHMLPTDLLLNMGSSHGLAMVFSMLLAAIIWNLGTWYFGLPASSSHTLIGAIIGIGLTNALMTGTSVVDALNIPKVLSIFGSLIVSLLSAWCLLAV